MKCATCGEDVEPSAIFCGNCGAQLQQLPAQSAVQPVTSPTPTATQPVTLAQSALPPTPAPAPSPASDPVPVQPTAAQPVAAASQPTVPSMPQPQPAIPGYAIAQPVGKASGKLTIALVLAIVSIPAAIVPIAGIVLAVLALVLASKNHKVGHVRFGFAIACAVIGILLSLLIWAANVNRLRQEETGFDPASSIASGFTYTGSASQLYEALFGPLSDWL